MSKQFRVPATLVKLKHHGWGSRVSGKKKNWPKSRILGPKFRENVRRMLGRPLVRNKAM